jgi:hypothetical protein
MVVDSQCYVAPRKVNVEDATLVVFIADRAGGDEG